MTSTGPFRPMPPPGDRATAAVAGPDATTTDPVPGDPAAQQTGHPAVDAAVQAIRNAAGLPPADQIAQYEAAHGTLQETLATIDQG
ncbi:hypothetical protein O7608_22230 [Solwaraspora sp. WMMA2056]|uniref:hypothetical protein n=1 Tax=Solwaraspora sp. WMMA2056 TaxID=3015161 RepID=UPI00259B683F|nr:hypothetical protein [Solwaraspora sp. WMMA2056]WJK39178.1 hypothetical protein O7608_22230 [Solwaraspora sp. WMMA2056]